MECHDSSTGTLTQSQDINGGAHVNTKDLDVDSGLCVQPFHRLRQITPSQRHVQKHLYGLDKNDASPRIIRSHPAQSNKFPTRYLNPFSDPDLPPTIPYVSEQIDVC